MITFSPNPSPFSPDLQHSAATVASPISFHGFALTRDGRDVDRPRNCWGNVFRRLVEILLISLPGRQYADLPVGSCRLEMRNK